MSELISLIGKVTCCHDLLSSMQLTVKVGKKPVTITFVKDPKGGEGTVKSKKIFVAPGLDRNTSTFYKILKTSKCHDSA